MRLSGPHLLPVTMFFGSFAWSFVFVSLPFHIQRISPLDPAATLRWTGWILGITSLVTVVTAPVWGRYAARGDPKACYVAVEALQGLGFFVMALATTLSELFLARLILGAMGAASTLAFIMAGRVPDTDAVRRRIATLQSSMTVGQVIGPLVGAIAAARMGIRASFVLGGLILLGCAAIVHWGVPRPLAPVTATATARPVRRREVAAARVGHRAEVDAVDEGSGYRRGLLEHRRRAIGDEQEGELLVADVQPGRRIERRRHVGGRPLVAERRRRRHPHAGRDRDQRAPDEEHRAVRDDQREREQPPGRAVSGLRGHSAGTLRRPSR